MNHCSWTLGTYFLSYSLPYPPHLPHPNLTSRGTGGIPFIPIYALRQDRRNVLRTFYHQEYFRSFERYPSAPKLDARTKRALDAYDAILEREDMWLDMNLQAGDVQLVSNHYVLHARTAFRDPEPAGETSNDEKRRHLLRLWLSLDGEGSHQQGSRWEELVSWLDKGLAVAKTVKSLAIVKVKAKLFAA